MSGKSFSVVELTGDGSVKVTKAVQLQNFTRRWIECSELWPQTVFWMSEDLASEDIECKILCIDSN